jgi:hypothetical protein
VGSGPARTRVPEAPLTIHGSDTEFTSPLHDAPRLPVRRQRTKGAR